MFRLLGEISAKLFKHCFQIQWRLLKENWSCEIEFDFFFALWLNAYGIAENDAASALIPIQTQRPI
jgi:hypothetical protein